MDRRAITTGHATPDANVSQRLRIDASGLVQGVGFRPFVYRLATRSKLTGWVRNTAGGAEIEVEGPRERIDGFLRALRDELPSIARIDQLTSLQIDLSGDIDFGVLESDAAGKRSASVLPDIATCHDCLTELFDPANRRYRYPFTNCTNCGPRYSIMEAIPYDRESTTMKSFLMCNDCSAEYEDPSNRRFHAQPNACPTCGPCVELWSSHGEALASRNEAIERTCSELRQGRIVALKGLGGFQLVVNAADNDAVSLLRRRKAREEKPFAIMYPNMETVEQDCVLSDKERQMLFSVESPIVLVRRRDWPQLNDPIVSAVAPRNPYLGVMLPYTPLHHVLLSDLGFPIVATSGNRSDEPICIDEKEAVFRLGEIADFFLVHNRPIARQVDDSVIQMIDDEPMMLRSARGFAPVTVELPAESKPMLAFGAHLKNTVACAVGKCAVVSQHVGDLDTTLSIDALRKTAETTMSLFDVYPQAACADLHHDYESTRFAAASNLPVTAVQHHLAHVLSCMTENKISPPVLGVAWDGTGLGSDGTVWGGEFLSIDFGTWSRCAHLANFRLPGGEQAIREARRSALAVLYETFGDEVDQVALRLMPGVFSNVEISTLVTMLRQTINSPVSSSAGRLFDAVASICGISHVSQFEGQSAMMLQFAAEMDLADGLLPFELVRRDNRVLIDWKPTVRAIVSDLDRGKAVPTIACEFHATLAAIVAEVASRMDIENVALSGGCFQNRLLLKMTISRLREKGLRPFWQRRVPSNDGGISLGQIAAAVLNLTEVR